MSKNTQKRRQLSTPRASLCVLGQVMGQMGVLEKLKEVKIPQKVLRYTPQQKVAAVLGGMLAGASTVKETATTVGTDWAVQQVFGLRRCPDQSTLQDTLDAAIPANVEELRGVHEEMFLRYSPAVHRLVAGEQVWVDIDLSPLPAGAKAEGSERGYMGRERTKRGRKLLRIRTAPEQEVVYDRVLPGNVASGLETLKDAVKELERILGLTTKKQRGRIVVRLDSGFGGESSHRWLLGRGYHLVGKMKSSSRVRKLAATVSEWSPTSSEGREVGEVSTPVELGRETSQYAVRTPSEDKPQGVHYSVVVTTLELTAQETVDAYDGRAGIENDFKGDKQGLGLRTRRKRKLVAQEMVVLLAALAHNTPRRIFDILIWTRRWLSRGDACLKKLGIVRLVKEVWSVLGRVTFQRGYLRSVRVARSHPMAGQAG